MKSRGNATFGAEAALGILPGNGRARMSDVTYVHIISEVLKIATKPKERLTDWEERHEVNHLYSQETWLGTWQIARNLQQGSGHESITVAISSQTRAVFKSPQ